MILLSRALLNFITMTLKMLTCLTFFYFVQFLDKLKYLDLSFSEELKQMPDLSGVPILEKLVLVHCSNLTEVHPSLVHHKNLVLLNLSSCKSLQTLPGKLEMSSLKELILSHCWSFENLPEFGECMKHLLRLSLNGTIIRKLPTSIGCLVGLSDLDLNCCINLVFLPHNIGGLKSLRILNASWCPKLHRLPTNLMAKKYIEKLYAIEFELPPFVSSLPFLSTLDLSYCYLSEEQFPLDFCHFPSLTHLNLSRNRFVSVPISTHKFPKLRYLWLNHCPMLQHLPELPSSIIELEAWDCDSLNTTEFNPLSKAYSVFASRNPDCGQVINMVLSGRNIPTWFVHQQDGNRAPVLQSCPLIEKVGIALCFLLQISGSGYGSFEWCLVIRNGNRFITKRMLHQMEPGFHIYILCLTNDYFSDEFHQDHHFELVAKVSHDFEILSSGARWVQMQDIEDLNKSIEPMLMQ